MLVKAKVDGFYGESIKRAGKTFQLSARETQEVDEKEIGRAHV